jgi:hypothetical protein
MVPTIVMAATAATQASRHFRSVLAWRSCNIVSVDDRF